MNRQEGLSSKNGWKRKQESRKGIESVTGGGEEE